ncbi:hypothetical protein E5288_WYG013554 [Bos mutus]|uniref:Dol-P-Glc:Glc(2)Man(9)GlcNAc(2)-PP-Dol alpha-1,2-glucosyltransferase n=1 Tax=Bos mutus TaxID=72004 RepID=A0A6B0QQR0_9CETA|nr:hypothetical protein [Bos mutus]
MEKCRLLMVRGGNSRKKADKDLQEKQLFSFQTIKLLKSEALRSPRRALREPYMDEIFHLPQAQRYCEGHFSLSQWDPMITTLPGLYLLSVGVVKPASWIFGWSEHVVCSIGMLRFVNLLFSVGNFYLLYLLLRKVQPRHKSFETALEIEAGSMFFTLFAYLMCLYGNHKTSALLGFCGFMFRQTNIIWAIFCAGNVIAQKLTEAWKTELQKKKEERPTPIKGPFSEFRKILQFLLAYSMSFKNLSMLLLLTWPYILLMFLFCAFVAVNGGIVIEKPPQVHLLQVCLTGNKAVMNISLLTPEKQSSEPLV